MSASAATDTDDNWRVNCSDEERFNPAKERGVNTPWEPKAEEILRMYTILSEKGVLELEWQCPGRRSPSVHSNESDGADRRAVEENETKTVEPNEFDFDDEGLEPKPSPKITPRRRTNPPSNAQKRVAKFDKVMLDVRRHRELDAIDKTGHQSHGAKR